MNETSGVEIGDGVMVCSNHGVRLSNEQCLCDYGWGSTDCSVSLVDKIGSNAYGVRWFMVGAFTCMFLFSMIRMRQALLDNYHILVVKRRYKRMTTAAYRILFNTRVVVLMLIVLTTVFNAINWIDPYCQVIFTEYVSGMLSIYGAISALLSMMLMIRLLAATYIKFQPLKQRSVRLLDWFFGICASIFCCNIVLWAVFASFNGATTTKAVVNAQVIFGYIYMISGALFVFILNIGGCLYISTTLGSLAKSSNNGSASNDAQLAARSLLRAMRGVQVCSSLCVILFLGVSIIDPNRQNLVLRLVCESLFRTLILVACFAITHSIGERRRYGVITVTQVAPMPTTPTSPTNLANSTSVMHHTIIIR